MIGILFDKSNGSCTDWFILPSFAIIDPRTEGEHTADAFTEAKVCTRDGNGILFPAGAGRLPPRQGDPGSPCRGVAAAAPAGKRYSGRPGRPIEKSD